METERELYTKEFTVREATEFTSGDRGFLGGLVFFSPSDRGARIFSSLHQKIYASGRGGGTENFTPPQRFPPPGRKFCHFPKVVLPVRSYCI